MKPRFSQAKVVFFLTLLLNLLAVKWGYPQEVTKYPIRPINMIIPMSSGTTADLGMRLLGREAEKYLGQPIVVVNKAGGGGSIGYSAIATAKPDGYNIGLCVGAAPTFIMPFLEKLPYHPINDFKYILQYLNINLGVIVKGDSPFRSFKELIGYARQNPKKLTYGTNAPNSIGNLIIEQVAKKEEAQLTHIPFKSSTEFQTALLGNHIHFAAGDFNVPQVEAGETRLLLSFMEKRPEDFPQIPILKDLGYDIPCPSLNGIFGPKDLPNDIVKKLEEAFSKAIKEPAFIKGIKDLHLYIFYRNSQELEEFMVRNYETYAKVLKEMGFIK